MRATALVLSVLIGGVVQAAPSAEKVRAVERLAAEANGAYKAGDFLRAAELLEKAIAIAPLTPVIYNLAKAYDKLTEDEKALELYKRYVAAADTDPKLKQRAENRIVALRASVDAIKQGKPRRGDKEAIPSETLIQPDLQPPPPTPPPPPPPVDPMVAAKRRRNIDRGIGLGLASLGVACVGIAIGLSVAALNDQHAFNATLVEDDKRQLRSQAQGFAAGADALYVVGAVAVGVSGYFIYRGFRPLADKDKKAAWLVPSISPSGAGLVAGGVF